MTQPRMRTVSMVYVYDPERDGPNPDRVGELRTLPRAEARTLVNNGEARYADEPVDEADRPLADLSRQAVLRHANDAGITGADTMTKSQLLDAIRTAEAQEQAEQQREDLTKLTKDELRGRLAELRDQGVTVDEPSATAKKDELVAAVESAMEAARTGAVDAGPSVEDGTANVIDTGDTPPVEAAAGDEDGGAPIRTVMPGAAGNPVPDTLP